MNFEKIDVIRSKSLKDLCDMIGQVDAGLFIIKSKAALDKSVARPDIIKKMKRYKAVILTVIREFELR